MKKLKKSVIVCTTASIACILANGCAVAPEEAPDVYGPPIDYEESYDNQEIDDYEIDEGNDEDIDEETEEDADEH